MNGCTQLLTRVLIAAVVAGTIDIGAAALINRVNPIAILQGIAGVAFPSAALAGEIGSALIGFLVQWGLSFIIAAICIGFSARIRMLREHWVAAGLSFGVVIFGVMNYLVLPLSRFGHAPHFTPFKFAANLIAMFVFGLIVAWYARTPAMKRNSLPGVSRDPTPLS